VREAPTCANTSRQITGTTCDCGQIVGTVWARTASARPRRLKATGAVVTTKTAIDAIVSWCARRSCIETSSTVSRSRNSAPDRDLGRSPHTGQALILIPGATAAFVSRRRVPRSHAVVDRADSSIAIAWVRWGDQVPRKDSRPIGVIRPSGCRRRRQRAEDAGPEPAITASADQFFEKSSVLDVSDDCTPTPMVSVSTTTASRARTCPTPAASVATMGRPKSRRQAGS
jgi:hypothetical protein